MSTVTAITEASSHRLNRSLRPHYGPLTRFGLVMALGQIDLLIPILSDERREGHAYQSVMQDC